MPKIIKNLRARLLEEAGKQVSAKGYSGMSISSVADACGISVGTIYNYFPSKNMLVVAFVQDDWNKTIESWKEKIRSYRDNMKKTEYIYNGIGAFADKYKAILFRKSNQEQITNFSQIHPFVRDNIAELLNEYLPKTAPSFTAQFLAESLISWPKEGIAFSSLRDVIAKLFC